MIKKFFKKYLVMGIIILLFGAVFNSFVNSKELLQKANIKNIGLLDDCDIVVDDEGDGDYTTIQEAIDSATEGQTICIYSGTYFENIEINKTITLKGIDEELGIGDDTGKPIIDGKDKHSSIYVTADEVIIIGLNVLNNNNQGIYLFYSSYCLIKNNDFKSCGINIYGELPQNYNSHEIENNSIDGKPIRYYKKVNNKIFSMETGQIILTECNNWTIHNVTLCNAIGIQISYSTNIKITYNHIYDNNQGIVIFESQDVNISNNNISNNNWGVTLWNSGSSYFDSEIKIYKNIISRNTNGILIAGCDGDIIIEKNNITFNKASGFFKGIGIYVTGGAFPHVEIRMNIIDNNRIGIYYLGWAVNLYIFNNYISYNNIGFLVLSGHGFWASWNDFLQNTLTIKLIEVREFLLTKNNLISDEEILLESKYSYGYATNNYWGGITDPRRKLSPIFAPILVRPYKRKPVNTSNPNLNRAVFNKPPNQLLINIIRFIQPLKFYNLINRYFAKIFLN